MITPKPLTNSNFKNFGDVISLENCIEKVSINRGWTDRYDNISQYKSLDNSKPIYSIFKGFKRPSPLSINMLELHPIASQAFIPLNGGDWLIIVCDIYNNEPNLNKIQCFKANSFQGINYNPGVWHHPLIVLDETQDFLIIDRDGSNDNNSENVIECNFEKKIVSY